MLFVVENYLLGKLYSNDGLFTLSSLIVKVTQPGVNADILSTVSNNFVYLSQRQETNIL